MRRRYVEIDALKVLGIVSVVLIHGLGTPWDPALSPLELWLQRLTRFAVPAFLFASGFLYATERPVSSSLTLRRLRRVLVPYAIASLGAQLWWQAHGVARPDASLATDLLFGASFGPFYYVFVIAVLIAVTPLFARLSRAALGALTLALLVAQWAVDAAALWPLPFFWHLRNPLLWWAYFAVGWWVRLHAAAIERAAAAHRVPLVAALAVAGVGLALLSGGARSAEWLLIWVVLALVVAGLAGVPRAPDGLARLSDATYAIYLFHLFFLYEAQIALGTGAGDFTAILVPWGAGLVGSLALVAAARWLLRERSRDWIGA